MLEEGLTISYQIKQVYFSAKTPFQEVEVVDTVPYGRALITDRLMQSAENDEHVYHESLVQVGSSLSSASSSPWLQARFRRDGRSVLFLTAREDARRGSCARATPLATYHL